MLSPGALCSQRRGLLLQACVAALLVCTICHIPTVAAQPKTQARNGGESRFPEFLYRASQIVREMLVYVLGEETLRSVTEVFSNIIWILCTGISSGLITISGLLRQLLDVVGLDGKQISGILAITPEQVQHILLWATLAFVGYWMMSLVLGLVLSLLSRLLWSLKIFLFLLAFFYLVTAVSDPHLLATSLMALVGLYALLGWVTSGSRSSGKLEAKVRSLERQVEELRMRQRRKKDDH